MKQEINQSNSSYPSSSSGGSLVSRWQAYVRMHDGVASSDLTGIAAGRVWHRVSASEGKRRNAICMRQTIDREQNKMRLFTKTFRSEGMTK